MNLELVRAFFMWCTIINGALLIAASLILTMAGNRIFRIHGRLIPMTRESFDMAIYCFLGFFKIVVIVFNLVPYLALVIMG